LRHGALPAAPNGLEKRKVAFLKMRESLYTIGAQNMVPDFRKKAT
jgi:hypothetical protein